MTHDHDFCSDYHDVVVDYGDGPCPEIVVLCGSTRFSDAFREANLRFTLKGAIVLSIGCDTKSDAGLGIAYAAAEVVGDAAQVKAMLDKLHLRKIDLADKVFVLNVGGYVGYSTNKEIEYAASLGKRVHWLEPYVIGACGHRVAGSEYVAGYRSCEHCGESFHDDETVVTAADEKRLLEMCQVVADRDTQTANLLRGILNEVGKANADIVRRAVRLFADELSAPTGISETDEEATS